MSDLRRRILDASVAPVAERGVRNISEKSLGNVALFYLRRYSASRERLTQVLERKVKVKLRGKDAEFAEAMKLVAQVVERMAKAGYLDDARLAESKTASLHRQGKSSRVIELKLRQQGLSAEQAKRLAASTPERELEAATTLVQKKRLGVDPERKQKDFAVLMRAGFKADLARNVLATAAEAAALVAAEEGGGAEVIEFADFAARPASDLGERAGGRVLQLPGRSAPTLTLSKRSRPDRGPDQAIALVKKKRLGVDPSRKQKDLAVLIRAGFSYDVAKTALAGPSSAD
jgi:regulatory protein